MDFFQEIHNIKEEMPKVDSISSGITNYKFNVYQWLAIGIFVVCVFLGIIIGNLLSTCKTATYFSNVCTSREFNFSAMIFIWFISFLLSLFIFAIGHIISILNDIKVIISKKKGK